MRQTWLCYSWALYSVSADPWSATRNVLKLFSAEVQKETYKTSKALLHHFHSEVNLFYSVTGQIKASSSNLNRKSPIIFTRWELGFIKALYGSLHLFCKWNWKMQGIKYLVWSIKNMSFELNIELIMGHLIHMNGSPSSVLLSGCWVLDIWVGKICILNSSMYLFIVCVMCFVKSIKLRCLQEKTGYFTWLLERKMF